MIQDEALIEFETFLGGGLTPSIAQHPNKLWTYCYTLSCIECPNSDKYQTDVCLSNRMTDETIQLLREHYPEYFV